MRIDTLSQNIMLLYSSVSIVAVLKKYNLRWHFDAKKSRMLTLAPPRKATKSQRIRFPRIMKESFCGERKKSLARQSVFHKVHCSVMM